MTIERLLRRLGQYPASRSSYQVSSPSASGRHAPTDGGAGVYGAWLEVIAANGITVPFLVTSLPLNEDISQGNRYEYQIAYGAVGAEVAIGTWGWHLQYPSSIGIGGLPELPFIPPLGFNANERVSIRFRTTQGGATMYCFLNYALLPYDPD